MAWSTALIAALREYLETLTGSPAAPLEALKLRIADALLHMLGLPVARAAATNGIPLEVLGSGVPVVPVVDPVLPHVVVFDDKRAVGDESHYARGVRGEPRSRRDRSVPAPFRKTGFKNPVEQACYAALTSLGWSVTKRGWPDFLAFRNGQLIVVEAKRPGFELTYAQQLVIAAFCQCGIPCYVFSPDVGFRRRGPATSPTSGASQPSDLDGSHQLGDRHLHAADRPVSPRARITFDREAGRILGVSDEDRARWRDLYPAVDLAYQLGRAEEWLRNNPKRIRSNIAQYLSNWFAKEQDRAARRPVPRDDDDPSAEPFMLKLD